jgi:PadR family transcriptional regulator, regulatory protein PadR
MKGLRNMNNNKKVITQGGNNDAVALLLGSFELLVLLAVIDARPWAYGITIRDAADRRRHGRDDEDGRHRISLGAIYATLDRLERKGLVRSWRGDPTPARGGRSKRFFELTPRGELSVQRSLSVLSGPVVVVDAAT